jgi:CubicO group peptidase (beta-lactamase class C family)
MMPPALPAGMTAANWRTHPHSPWAFAHPGDFLPTIAVPPAPHLLPLPVGQPLNSSGWEEAPEKTHADGLIVVHRGLVVHERYAGVLEPEHPHLAFSISKAVTGLLAEWLIADRSIEPQAQALEHSPALFGTAFGRSTLRDLLDMRDGVPFDEDYANPDAAIHHYSRYFWGEGRGGVEAALRALPDNGERQSGAFSYRTPVSDAVGLSLEGATGSNLATQSSRLWSAAGAERAALWVRDTGARPIASAGFACTLRDLARFGLLIGNAVSGTGPEALVVAARAIAEGGDQAAFARSGQPTRPGYSYRSGWWVDHPRGALNALGVFGQRLHIDPTAELVIARFGSSPTASNQPTDILHAEWFEAIRAALDAR